MLKTLKLFIIIMVLLSLTVGTGLSANTLAARPAEETPLKPVAEDGIAYEINPDANGILWVSDWSYGSGGEIWGINPASGSHKIFAIGGGPSDARSDGAGNLWWADAESNKVGRLDTDTGNASIWEIPGSNGLFGTALDGAGGLWIADSSSPTVPSLYHLTAENKLYTYTLPAGSEGDAATDYVLASGSQVWLGDYVNSRIIRLDISTIPNTFTWWQPAGGSYPEGMALGSNGDLWWADPVLGELGKLQPGTNQVTRYTQSQVTSPVMVALKDGIAWFSSDNVFGRLDPSQNQVDPTTVATDSQQFTPPNSIDLAPSSTPTFAPSSGQEDWTDVNYADLYNQNGWLIFELPAGGSAWGIASSGEIWLVDQGRQVLARLPDLVQVTACKLSDADGNLTTTADQSPKPDWPVYLRVDGVRQELGKLTGVDGCAIWGGLQPGPAYGVEEDANGWTPLTPTSHDFGSSAAGQSYSYTFINQQAHFIYLPLVLR